MMNNRLPMREWGERIVLALVFTAIGAAIMIVFKPWGRQYFNDNQVENYLWRIGLSVLLLVVTGLVRRIRRLEKYWQIFLALFILSARFHSTGFSVIFCLIPCMSMTPPQLDGLTRS